MGRNDRTFTSEDVIRLYEKNLDSLEQEIVEVFFRGEPKERFVIRFDLFQALFDNIESIMLNIKAFPPVIRAAISTIIILNQMRQVFEDIAKARLDDVEFTVKFDVF